MPTEDAREAQGGTVAGLTFLLYAASILLIPFPRFGGVHVLGTIIQWSDFVFAGAGVVWVIALFKGELHLHWGRPHWALVGYAAVAILSFSSTPNLKTSCVKLLALAFLIALFAMTASLAADRRGWRRVTSVWMAGAFICSVLGLVGIGLFYAGVRGTANPFVSNYGAVPKGNYPRLILLFDNPNMLCNYLIVSCAIVGANWPMMSKRLRFVWAGVLITVGITMLFSLSTGVGGFVLGIGFAWISWARFRGAVRPVREFLVGLASTSVALGFLVLTIILLVPKGQGDVSLGPVDLQLAESGRVSVWKAALHTYAKHPVTGAGLGVRVAPTSNPRAFHSMDGWKEGGFDAKPTVMVMEAHDVWLNILGQIGLQGVITFGAFLFFLVRGFLPVAGSDPTNAYVRIILLSGFIAAVAFHGLFDAFEETRHLWWFLGVLWATRFVDLSAGRLQAGAVSVSASAVGS